MYLIIVGAGDIGGQLTEIAIEAGNEVVVIERDSARADMIASDHDCLVINDDATVKETLADAGADRADGIIATTEQDATNVMVSLLAKEFEIPSILSVVHNTDHMNIFREIGVNTMENPQELIAEHLHRSVSRPAIVDYLRIGDVAEVFEIVVTENAPIAGKTLTAAAEAGLITDDMLVVAVERESADDPITPRGNTEIHADDLLTVYSAVGATPAVTDIFGHDEDHTA